MPNLSCVRYAIPVAALIMGGLYVRRSLASKALWLVGRSSDCRHGTRAGRVQAGRGTDCRHGASAITTARTAHGSANAAPGSSCCAGLAARRSSRRDVITFIHGAAVSGRPRDLATGMPLHLLDEQVGWTAQGSRDRIKLSLISLATSGRAPRLPEVGPRDQQAVEERRAIVMDE